MASPALETLREELVTLRAVWEPELEGFRDFARLNVESETLQILRAIILLYDNRLILVAQALKALDDLAANQYPDIPVQPIPAAAFADLEAQILTQEAAFLKVHPVAEAVTVEITPGELEPIPLPQA